MTTWTTRRASPDTRRCYVSTQGSDSNTGLTHTAPVRTLEYAKTKLRNGYPDWLLLRRGEDWSESLGHWKVSGRSAAEPAVISTYGNAAERPRLLTGGDDGLFTQQGGGSPAELSHLHINGLHFEGHGESGLRFLLPGEGVLIEDTYVCGYGVNVVLNGAYGPLRSYTVRRSVIVDSTPKFGNGHSQGLYAYNVHGLLLDQNVLDQNGHPATIYNHNFYGDNGNSDVELRGNIISRASSHGAQMRSGGVARNNLFVRNPISLQLGGGNAPELGGVEFDCLGNVIVEGTNIDAENPRGWGLLLQNVRSGLCASNVIAHSFEGKQPVAINMDGLHRGEDGVLDSGVHGVAFERNVVWDWQGGIEAWGNVGGIVGWPEISTGPFPDPHRTVADYAARIKVGRNFEAFINAARCQSRMRWRPVLTAGAVNNYIRNGFNLGFP